VRTSALRGAVVGTAVGLLAFGGVASAALWSSQRLEVPVRIGSMAMGDATATVQGDLYPGQRNDVRLTFTNPNPVPAHVSAVTVERFTGDPALVPHLLADPVLAPDGVDPATGAPRPLLVPARGRITVTVPDAVGLAPDAPDIQGAEADVVLRATYTAVPGDEAARLQR
jgi:hypothetical protein